ncbi:MULTISPECIES: TetR-like C-terminal domain-containing protein [Kocuria]|uniref:TetR-like C-terminal domain-containing protein n=1 Tax=Kocuria TaxID=57493 RepID=UPI000A53CCA2|nr:MULTISPECIES: TetR-like C-terminal domain-containing protein [Kocuria]
MIAEFAGVTPSTIYRRWGNLDALFSDVATENLRPEQSPEDRGSFEADILAWAEAFAEEMASNSGRAMIRDVLSGGEENAGTCSDYAADQIDVMLERARARGESVPSRERVVDVIVAPLMYRILFRPHIPANTENLVGELMRAAPEER